MHGKHLTESAQSKRLVCDSMPSICCPSPAVSLSLQPYPDVVPCRVTRSILEREKACLVPSPPKYCQDHRAEGHSIARGCDRTAPRAGLSEGPCSTLEKGESGFGRMEVDPREMCMFYVCAVVWWGRRASHDWEASLNTGTCPRNLCSLRPLGVSPAGAADDGWGWNF